MKRKDSLTSKTAAESTTRSYESAWKNFTRWCYESGKRPMPSDAETIAIYTTALIVDGKSTRTALAHLAAITHKHKAEGAPKPDCLPARAVIAGARRNRQDKTRQKAALTPKQLHRMAKRLNTSTPQGARDRAALILGFATSLRRSEIAALNAEDITEDRRGLIVINRFSKTDQTGKGRLIPVFRGQIPETCPCRNLKAWMKQRGTQPGPLFTRLNAQGKPTNKRIHPGLIAEIVQLGAKAIGLDERRYGAHSLRAGAITAAAEAHRSEHEIMALSGHKSSEVMRTYIRRAAIFPARDPLGGVL
jgi:integrase